MVLRAVKIIMLGAVFFPLRFGGAQVASGQTQGALQVTVVNGTPEGRSVAGDLVTVRIYREKELVDTLQGKVDGQSRAFFANVPRGEDLYARISCEHDGAAFYSQIDMPLIPAHPPVAAQVRVFDVTGDTSSLSITTHHLIFRRGEDFLYVAEYMRIRNASLRAIKPEIQPGYEKPVVLQVFLPEGYKNFEAASYFVTEDLVWTDEGFYDPIPVAPGEGDIRFSYRLDIKSAALDITKKFSLPTEDCAVFLALPQVQPQGLGSMVTSLERDGVVYDYYSLGPRRAGEAVSFKISGFIIKKSDKTWLILLLVFIMVMAAAFSRTRMKKRRR